MASDLNPILGGALNAAQGSGSGGLFGGRSSAVAKQAKKETELLLARTEIAVLQDQSRAFLAASAMSNVGMLVGQAEQIVRMTPAAASLIEPILQGYAIGAAQAVARHG
ncbi:hypothetical protein [Psychromicrobium xiongbiense]|uniref:hypothetical protein n=1 Tax=Psychromicrobium xiongbiense TaxID=3051184 RepID=UPI0025573092|nr:hypothetical protein [Psychromicrobium sp. YIM S02556]